MAITTGTVKTSDVTAAATSAGVGQAPDQRRLYDFGDRVAELSPEESPFFVYLSKVAKRPTTDPVFRFLENRSRIDWTSRNMVLASTTGTVAVDTNYTFAVADADTPTASIDWLTKGMVLAIQTLDSALGNKYIVVRVNGSISDAGTSTTFEGRVVSLSKATDDDGSAATGYNVATDNDLVTVIGTSFGEGTGSPDTWASSIDDDFGYTQIFKTAAEMSNTSIATNYRGYANEWQRIWNLKLREHKVDIERAMLFGQRARSSSIQYSEGIVGHIVVNSAAEDDNAKLSYSSGAPYHKTWGSGEFTYDALLSDFEVFFDPARGGESNKLALASLPVISFFNKLGSGVTPDSFLVHSLAGNQNELLATTKTNENQSPYRMNIDSVQGSFGHSLMKIDTVHGSLALVKEPLFRGFASSYLCMVDMSQVSYRPLVGNGLNRDTHIITNVQQADEDLRKDMILTEAGLEITLPEAHCLYNFESI